MDNWLREKRKPRLALPEICGYIPVVHILRKALVVTDKKRTFGEEGASAIEDNKTSVDQLIERYKSSRRQRDDKAIVEDD